MRSDPAQAWIVHLAAVTSLGGSLQELWERLLAGQTAIRPVSRFSTAGYTSDVAACIPDLASVAGKSMMHDLLHRLAQEIGPVPSDAFLITATTKGGIDSLERLQRGGCADYRDLLLSSLPEILGRRLGLKHAGINISAACASSTIAVARGAAMIASGMRDAVLVCCADLVTEFVFSGFSSLGALSPVPCMPFDRRRRGMSLGEGAASLLLMSRDRARKENRPALGRILGWGAANDASHITAPARDGSGLIKAVTGALKQAGLAAEQISAVCAHGTGTVHNDAMELTAFHRVFGNHTPPLFSVKGAIGHALGAAGGIEAALGAKALSRQTVPPTTGFLEPETGAEGWVHGDPVRISGDCLLSTNSGFGGINAAIILGKGTPE
ncbi:MAG: beta-ketoacyl-[acyl-carrier-protein] synthase family protein [Deltaproteobacteria bacterium]|nr:beta-ketoacyl-[acyl-carrier-protein] synthase family protein [Deltaproteobacteria bacterium]